MTFEDAVWIGLGIRVEPPVLAKVEVRGPYYEVRVRVHKRDWTQTGETWVTAFVTMNEREAEEQTSRWQAKLEANPYATVAWDHTRNRL